MTAYKLLALPFFGLALTSIGTFFWWLFEGIAILTDNPTLSMLARWSGPVQHPVWTYFIVGLVCFIIGGLIVHITGWNA